MAKRRPLRRLSEQAWEIRICYCPSCDEEYENDVPYVAYINCPECGHTLANSSKREFNRPSSINIPHDGNN